MPGLVGQGVGGYVFLGRDPSQGVWRESHLQMYCIMMLRRDGYTVAGDMNAGKRNPGAVKAMGCLAGEPDLRIYRRGGKLLQVELKAIKGRLSPEQKNHHNTLTELGYDVHTVFTSTPVEAY